MASIRKVLAALKRADEHFNLIAPGDTIVVGVSGGKDSVLLAYALSLYAKFAQKDFKLIAVTIDLGFPEFDTKALEAFMADYQIEYHTYDSKSVYPILSTQQKLQNLKHLPCSICSRMKKAAINQAAHYYGANKVAFAHHIDDAVETLVMNQIHGGRVATFAPKMHLDREDIIFIRPFAYLDEETIILAAHELNLPILKSTCPANQKTTREDIKGLLSEIYKTYPQAQKNFWKMLTNYEQVALWGEEINYQTSIPHLTITPVSNSSDKTHVLYIRMKVFCEEQHIAIDEEITPDENDWHYLLLKYEGKPIGTIRYQKSNGVYTLGRLAILKEYRNNGYARELIRWLEQFLFKKEKPLRLALGGQQYLKDFYLSLGYKIVGEQYLDANIMHFHFIKVIE